MKTKAVQAIVRGMAPVIRSYVASAQAQTDIRQAQLDVRLELKAAEIAAAFAQENAALRERIAVLETRPQLPGPAGEKGDPGRDGADGKAGMTYHGVFVDGKQYEKGDVTTWAGSMWHCDEATTAKPGEYAGAKSWTMCVKRGRDGGVK